MKIKNILLIGTLVLTMGLTGCSSNEKKENTDKDYIVETKPNELTVDETRKLKVGDTIANDKEVNREVLEQQGMDFLYAYDKCSYAEDGSKVGNSERVIYSYEAKPSEVKEEAGKGITITTKYVFKNKQIVKIEFVKDENGNYKKKPIIEDKIINLVSVINEKNIK